MGGGGGQNTNTIQQQDPWAPLQDFLYQGAFHTNDIWRQGLPEYYPGQTYLGPNEWQQGSMEGLASYANNLGGLTNQALGANSALMNPSSNPYYQAGINAVNPSMGTLYGGASMFGPSAGTAQNIYGMLPYSTGTSMNVMDMFNPSAMTAAQIMGGNTNYSPNLYTPGVQFGGQADPTQALTKMMSSGGMNPYLDAMVNASQQNTLQNFGTTSQQAADLYESQIAPQIQDARTLISDALNQFTEQALPQIQDRALRAGSLNSTRTDLAQGQALSGIYDSLNRELGNLARTADLTGANVYQDILRNQNYTMDDLGAMASSMYGGAWDQSQQNILGAANTAAGLQTNLNNNLLGMAQLDLQRQLGGENISLDRMKAALDASLGYGNLAGGAASDYANLIGGLTGTWGNIGGDLAGTGLDYGANVYGQGLDAMVGGLGLLPGTIQGGSLPYSLMGQAGDLAAGFDQQALQDAMDRWNYQTWGPFNFASDYSNLMASLAGVGGTSTRTSDLATNPYLGAAGGGIAGGMLGAGYGGFSSFNPYTAGLGALLGYMSSR